MKLVTKDAWEMLTPRSQGYVLYMQEELPGSELKGLKNPYRKNSANYAKFEEGERVACQDAQDSEE
jgi:hypothetical protein